ncbi:MAG: MarR family transcriptional regulator [Pseudomonadota bacterium]
MTHLPFYLTLPFESAFVGARLQRLADLLETQGNAFFEAGGSATPARCASSVLFLDANGPASLVEIARAMKQDHQLTAHRIRQLSELGFVARKVDPHDSRKKILSLTRKGKAQADLLIERCQQAAQVFERLNVELGFNLAEALDAAFAALERKTIDERYSDVADQ